MSSEELIYCGRCGEYLDKLQTWSYQGRSICPLCARKFIERTQIMTEQNAKLGPALILAVLALSLTVLYYLLSQTNYAKVVFADTIMSWSISISAVGSLIIFFVTQFLTIAREPTRNAISTPEWQPILETREKLFATLISMRQISHSISTSDRAEIERKRQYLERTRPKLETYERDIHFHAHLAMIIAMCAGVFVPGLSVFSLLWGLCCVRRLRSEDWPPLRGRYLIHGSLWCSALALAKDYLTLPALILVF